MKRPFSVETPIQSSGYLFWKVSALWQRGLRDLLTPLDLTHTQYVLLASLGWLDRSSQAELAKHTGCDEMTVSAVVRTIAAKGWVDRQNDNQDRRAKLLRITPLGAALADKAVPLVEKFDRQFFIDRLGNRKDSFLKSLDWLSRAEEPRRTS